MHNVKLIVMDIDGTLLGKGHKVSKKTLDILKMARAKNIKICLATGRHFYRTEEISRIIESDVNNDYLVCLNGGALYKYENKNLNVIYEKTFSEEEFNYIYDESKKIKLNCFSYDKNNETAYVVKKSLFTFILGKVSKRKPVVYDNETKNISYKIIGNGKPAAIKKIKQILQKKSFRIYDWSYSNKSKRIEISPKDVNKVCAIKKLAELEKINKEEIVFFGDGDNDKELLSWVKYGVAMGNAHKEVLRHASYKTKKNTKDGIEYFLKSILNI
ncbi:HAD superfamily hydrolase [Spiroplasma litorale]|uniref:HAD superfamily hydrolase n=1 Tax=Spiroplasma litorale TaxID=216942 RepID=A0A0K1W0F9_9MOLU|nr:Cof-type HAD-IIB family hydrolase [Spiroplasma litorale]AKX33785.1 HAD superfamily hydrolase [Spiroplasma litorale]